MSNTEKNTLHINGAVTYTKIITNSCGQIVKLVGRFFGLKDNNTPSILVDVYRKDGDDWVLCKDQSDDKIWVSREHYVKYQRPEKLQVAGHGPILKTAQEFQTLILSSKEQFTNIKENLFSFKGIDFQYINPNEA
jgi:hypothetical protein